MGKKYINQTIEEPGSKLKEMKEDNNPYGIKFEEVFGKDDKELAGELIDVWKKHNLLSKGESGEERMKQVVFVVKNKNNEIIGISTAYPIYVEQLKNTLFAFRCMLIPEYRYPGLLTKLTVQTRDFLEEIHSTYDPYCIGIITEVQNTKLNEHRKEAVYPGSGFTFIGYSKRGFQIRIYYFKGAKI